MPLPQVKFEVGQLWSTSTGRTVEIVAVDTIEAEDDYGFQEASITAIAYTFVGGSVVHLRAASGAKSWQHINQG